MASLSAPQINLNATPSGETLSLSALQDNFSLVPQEPFPITLHNNGTLANIRSLQQLRDNFADKLSSFADRHPKLNFSNDFSKIFDEMLRKESLFSKAQTQIAIVSASLLTIIMALSIAYLCIKHRKMKTLMSSFALHALVPTSEALPIPLPDVSASTMEARRVICYDPRITAILTIISLIGIIVYAHKRCKSRALCRGHKFANSYDIYLFICSELYYVPLRLAQGTGQMANLEISRGLHRSQLVLTKNKIWDALQIRWLDVILTYDGEELKLPRGLVISLWDKFRLRKIMQQPTCSAHVMVKQGVNWFNLEYYTPQIRTPIAPNPALIDLH
jgi:hypothetical protein